MQGGAQGQGTQAQGGAQGQGGAQAPQGQPGLWKIIFEEASPPSLGYQIYPDHSVDPAGSGSIVRPSNPSAVLEVVANANGTFELRNVSMGNRLEALVEPSPLGYRLVSGPLRDRLILQLRSFIQTQRSYPIDGRTLELHFH